MQQPMCYHRAGPACRSALHLNRTPSLLHRARCCRPATVTPCATRLGDRRNSNHGDSHPFCDAADPHHSTAHDTLPTCSERAGACGTTTSSTAQPSRSGVVLSRRSAVVATAAATCALALPGAAAASKLPAFADRAWESLGGGPADLYFPDQFLGVWEVASVLAKVDTPMGEEAVPNIEAVQRAVREDLDKPQRYRVAFMRDRTGRIIFDRRYNTASMLAMYYNAPTQDYEGRVAWNPDDPNILTLSMPGMSVRTRVTRRSEEFPTDDRIETSEYVESVYETGGGGSATRIKASQCFTKYKWRPLQVAARDKGPAIVATQVVSDFLTPYDGEEKYLRAGNKPYAQYTYRMAFTAAADPDRQ